MSCDSIWRRSLVSLVPQSSRSHAANENAVRAGVRQKVKRMTRRRQFWVRLVNDSSFNNSKLFSTTSITITGSRRIARSLDFRRAMTHSDSISSIATGLGD